MSYQIADFTSQVDLLVRRYPAYANRAAELNAIASLTATDPTRHDKTIETAPVGLQPGNAANSPFTNAVLEAINRGKAGNLTPLAMGNAITGELSKIFPPAMTSAPVVSGTGTVGQTLTTTVGNWTYVPTSYAYQWLRGGNTPIGSGAATYVLQAGDSGANVSCRVTATNAAGSTAAVSNAIAVA
jgi:hypothetical protein